MTTYKKLVNKVETLSIELQHLAEKNDTLNFEIERTMNEIDDLLKKCKKLEKRSLIRRKMFAGFRLKNILHIMG
ncbi:MAG: hypothetical protein N2645_15885 [Clostridia bacterium]|nr:hypothetical protein [Clostridia bacterium]